MKNKIKKGWQRRFQLGVGLLLSILVNIGSASVPVQPASSCPGPGDVTLTGRTAHSMTFSWSGVSGALGYHVWYLRTSDGTIGPVQNTTSTSITFSGLSAGTYRFYFSTLCETGTSDYIILEDLLIL